YELPHAKRGSVRITSARRHGRKIFDERARQHSRRNHDRQHDHQGHLYFPYTHSEPLCVPPRSCHHTVWSCGLTLRSPSVLGNPLMPVVSSSITVLYFWRCF